VVQRWNGELSTPSLGITYSASVGEGNHGDETFNSLSRDHLLMDDARFLVLDMRVFQLPLSGSPTISTRRKSWRSLSTPSLGITDYFDAKKVVEVTFNSLSRDHPHMAQKQSRYSYFLTFQLPLSGSLDVFGPNAKDWIGKPFNSLSRDHPPFRLGDG
jgi:hypothetical protein